MFSVAFREQVSSRVLAWAQSDKRIAGAAIVGSLAVGPGDRWSDLDLTFAVVEGVNVREVLQDWTERLVVEFDATRLFDLPSGTSIYRVLLLPGCLQFDLSFTPASDFGAIGPNFKLLFGNAVEKQALLPPTPGDLFGYGTHHLVRARVCIERDRPCQAEYWLSAARDYALSLACLRRSLPAHYGRGFDALPSDLRERLSDALVKSLDKQALLAALDRTIALLLQESTGMEGLSSRIRSDLQKLQSPERGS